VLEDMLKVQKNTTSGWVVVRTQRKHLIASLIFSLLAGSATQHVWAAGLGRLTVLSGLGQPLRAEVDITSLSKEEEASLSVRLASAEAFRNANIDASPVLSSVRFTIDNAPSGRKIVRITSSLPVTEPFLDLLLELNWNTGKLVREYTVLLDPPGITLPPVETSAPSVAISPSIVPSITPSVRPQTSPTRTVTPKPSSSSLESGSTGAAGDYTVKAGDSLGKIARRTAPAGVNLDQMLVSLYRANPDAFINNNMNRLKAGVVLRLPDAASASAVAPAEARKEVLAQSSNFAAYRQRVAGIVAKAPVRGDTNPASSGTSGTVGARVEDSAKKSTIQDQVKVAKADTTAAGASESTKAALASKQAEVEKAANAKAVKEATERAAALEKNVADMKALQLKNQQLAQQQAAADAKKVADAKAAVEKASAAKALADKAATDKVQADKAAAEKAGAAKALADKVAADKAATDKALADKAAAEKADAAKALADKAAMDTAAAQKAAADKALADKALAEKASAEKLAAEKAVLDKAAADKKATEATPPPVTPPAPAQPKAAAVVPKSTPPIVSTDSLIDNLTSPYVLGGLALVLLGSGYGVYRIRRKREFGNFGDSVTATRSLDGNSVMGTTGGQSVDTNNASVFNSNYLPLSNQMVSNEVDPVAEADVYIAYGRDKQAEEILRAAIVAQPERHNARLKLLEIYAGRKDLASFEREAKALQERTNNLGDDWKRAATLGAALDPANQLYSVGAAMAAVNSAAVAVPASLPVQTPISSVAAPAIKPPAAAVDLSATLPAPAQPLPSLEEAAFTLPAPMAALLDPPKAGDAALDFDLGISALDGRTMLMPDAVAAGDPSSAFLQPERAGQTGAQASEDLGIALEVNKSPTNVSTEAPVSTKTPAEADNSLDFDLGQAGDSSAASPYAQPAISTPVQQVLTPKLSEPKLTENSGLDFDLGALNVPSAPAQAEAKVTPAVPASADSEIGTKLSLASAYIAIGDNEGARELLSEVIALGTAEQKATANELLTRIG
jgi:pilus assembly protein FimV